MDAAERTRSFQVLVVYWILAAVAVAFVLLGSWMALRIPARNRLQVRVLERTVHVEVQEVKGGRSTYPALVAIAELR